MYVMKWIVLKQDQYTDIKYSAFPLYLIPLPVINLLILRSEIT